MRASSTRPSLVALALALGGAAGSIACVAADADRPAPYRSPPPTSCPSPADSAHLDPSAEIYDPRRIVRFDLELPPATRAALDAQPWAYAPATLRYCGVALDPVGVSLKGWGSFRRLDRKAAFRVKLDEYVPGQALRGLKRLRLNNALDDPTFQAEALAYRVYRAAGLPAPRANHALVFVDGEYLGLYVNVEAEDKAFLRRWFSSDEGNLYESHDAELVLEDLDQFEAETNEGTADGTDLRALVLALDASSPATLVADLEPHLDLDQALGFAALEALVGQWDGYAYSRFGQANYRLYRVPGADRFVFLPWGMDMAMKPLYPEVLVDPALGEGADRFPALLAPGGRLVRACLASPACRARFVAAATSGLAALEGAGLDAEARAAWAQIRDDALADPRTEFTNAYLERSQTTLLAWIRDRPAAARAELARELDP